MKPDWDKLTKEINGRGGSTLIGDVDCTAAGKPLCDSNGVQGFPTVKFGDPSALEDYQGGRDYSSLLKHAESLKPSCSPSNLDLCDEEQAAEINVFMEMDDASLDEKIAEKDAEIAAAEKAFETALEDLQNTYKKISEDKDNTVAEVKARYAAKYKQAYCRQEVGSASAFAFAAAASSSFSRFCLCSSGSVHSDFLVKEL